MVCEDDIGCILKQQRISVDLLLRTVLICGLPDN